MSLYYNIEIIYFFSDQKHFLDERKTTNWLKYDESNIYNIELFLFKMENKIIYFFYV
jgi:hypothetical protein